MQLSVRKWVHEMRQRISDMGVRGLLYIPFTIYLSLWYGLTSRFEPGQNIYDDEWDLLIILDACRVDTLREVADEYDFITDVDTRWSVGTQSAEWIAKTFVESRLDAIQNTAYITGNPYADKTLLAGGTPPMNNAIPVDFAKWRTVDSTDFYDIELLWRERDETYNVVLPQSLTDEVIKAGRENGQEKIIVHYMQPHLPYIGDAIDENRPPTEAESKGYQLMEIGQAERDEIYPLYRETLRYILDEVEELLENVNAERVAITADHGEAFGEHALYGHPEGLPFPIIKRVPWIETTATDRNTREPQEVERQELDVDIEDHLRELGYM